MYNYTYCQKGLKKISQTFYDAFITLREELILEPKSNTYFRLDNITCELDFDCKMIEYVSRPAHKGLTKPLQKQIREQLNNYFNKKWSVEDLSIIYTYLGNGCNRQLCIKFIDSDFDLEILKGDR